MCMGGGAPAAPAPQPLPPAAVAPPLPDPGQKAVKVAEGVKRTGDDQAKLAKTAGTGALRIALNVPGSGGGTGLNIPT